MSVTAKQTIRIALGAWREQWLDDDRDLARMKLEAIEAAERWLDQVEDPPATIDPASRRVARADRAALGEAAADLLIGSDGRVCGASAEHLRNTASLLRQADSRAARELMPSEHTAFRVGAAVVVRVAEFLEAVSGSDATPDVASATPDVASDPASIADAADGGPGPIADRWGVKAHGLCIRTPHQSDGT